MRRMIMNMNRLLMLPVIVLSVLFLINPSHADVLFQDVTANGYSDGNISITQEVIPTGVGEVGDYELITCSTVAPNGPNPFLAPSPNSWTELDNANCGGSFSCRMGIWGGFTNNPGSENIDCSWTDSTFVFAAGSYRFSNVAPDPIIDVECISGTGDTIEAPIINTEAVHT